jgi:hypothetical protein
MHFLLHSVTRKDCIFVSVLKCVVFTCFGTKNIMYTIISSASSIAVLPGFTLLLAVVIPLLLATINETVYGIVRNCSHNNCGQRLD